MRYFSSSSKATTLAVAIAFIVGGGVFTGLLKANELQARSPQEQTVGPTHSQPAVESTQEAAKDAVAAEDGAAADLGDLPERLTNVFVQLAKEVTPAVVQVEVRRPGTEAAGSLQDIPEPFRQFFNLPEGRGAPSQEVPEEMAGGTGFIISPDGYILTNAHVVEQEDRIVVNLLDRTSHTAELVGSDPTTDLAIIKIDGKDLPTLSWGSSNDLQVGEPVMAVGNPGYSGSESLDYTVTTGIVSALGRPLSIIRQSLQGNPDLAPYAIENFIQTDAVINPGNSGGPLVDLRGRVVGVNSAIASSNGHYQGYGFAIPADLANKVSADLMTHGRVQRGWLGISVTGISSEDAEVYNLPRVGGVLVQNVVDDSPAQKAGLKVEDVVVAVNGNPLQDSGDLQEQVAELGPGARAELELYRNGKRQLVSVRLGEAPFTPEAKAKAAPPEEGPEALLGMAVKDLTPDMASDLGFDRPGGAVVTQVTPWSSAMRKGITPGLKIEEVDHTPIGSAREFRQVMSGLGGGDLVTIKLEAPDGSTRIVNLRAEEK
ncbi:MAG: trypsin-like peptidase domain-containing protein [Gemmatimonadota bacterium]